MDDGALTKQLCPENEFGQDEGENFEPCCACDEAKYEVSSIAFITLKLLVVRSFVGKPRFTIIITSLSLVNFRRTLVTTNASQGLSCKHSECSF